MDRRTTHQMDARRVRIHAPPGIQRVAGADAPSAAPQAQGYGSDPDLTKTYHAGDLWPLILQPRNGARQAPCAMSSFRLRQDLAAPSAAGVVDFHRRVGERALSRTK